MYSLIKRTVFVDLSHYKEDELADEHFRASFVVAIAYFCIFFSSLLGLIFCKTPLDTAATILLIASQLTALIAIKFKAPIIIPGRILNVSFLIFIIVILFSDLDSTITVHRTYWFFAYPPLVFFMCGKKDGIIGSILLYVTVAIFMSDFFITLPLLDNDKIRFLGALALIIIATYGAESRRFSAMNKFLSITKMYYKKVQELSQEQKVRVDIEQKVIESAKLATLGEMAGGVAHEINSPLMVISGNANLLKKRLINGASTNDVIHYANKIISTVDRVDLIVKGLRSFVRSSENDPMQVISITAIVNRTLSLCRDKFAHAQIKISLQKIPENLLIFCHETEISQVLLNLLDNAFDALTDKDNGKVSISSSQKGRNIELDIVDNGPGIPPEIIEKMFMPFTTSKPVGKGTGLGLSICKSIIEKHSGSIYFDRGNPQTRIVITLPLFKY